MIIYLCRHGETHYNKQKKYYGSLDPSLTEKGKQQALQLVHKIQSLSLDTILTSGMNRTKETAEILYQRLDEITPINWIIEANLNERDFGAWEGKDADEIEETDPLTWQAFIEAPFDTTPFGAETYVAFKQRIITTIQEILSKQSPSSRLLIVGHQGALRVMVTELFDKNQNFWDLQFEHGKVYKYIY